MENSFLCITSNYYQIVSVLLFFIGLVGITTSKNLIKILIISEFFINSVNLLFISFASYKNDVNYSGYTIALYITAISSIIIVVFLNFIRLIKIRFNTINISRIYEKYKNSEV